MQIRKLVFPLTIVIALSYASYFFYAYVVAYLVPFSIAMYERVEMAAFALPGAVTAAIIGLGLAVITWIAIPKLAMRASFLALLPTLILLLWVVITHAGEKTWWVGLSDMASLLFFTYVVTNIGARLALARRR